MAPPSLPSPLSPLLPQAPPLLPQAPDLRTPISDLLPPPDLRPLLSVVRLQALLEPWGGLKVALGWLWGGLKVALGSH